MNWSPRYPDDYLVISPGYIRAPIEWYASHLHSPAGLNRPYAYNYLFGYTLGLSPGTRTLQFPNDENIRIMAISVAHGRM